MPRRRQRTVHLSAGVILVDPSGRILLELRGSAPDIPFPDHWGITGGEAHEGESPEETARREVQEETGLLLDAIHPFKVYEAEHGGTHYTTHFYHATTTRPAEEMVVGEGQALRFFQPKELDGLPLAYRHRQVLADFVASEAYHSCLSVEQETLARLDRALSEGTDWLTALLEAIARWEVPEEEVDGRQYRYLIGGEAFDWLLLAERLCEAVDGAVPADEREALLFFGRPPRELGADEFKRAIGDAKHRAHLNFLYGVTVEEALQLSVEEEILKERRSCVWRQAESVEQQVFERIYGRGREELLAAFREERAPGREVSRLSAPPTDEISYSDLQAFTYWLFKHRVGQGDPARVASDTRKALAQVSQLEAAARRRAECLASAAADDAAVVVEGEVVAHVH